MKNEKDEVRGRLEHTGHADLLGATLYGMDMIMGAKKKPKGPTPSECGVSDLVCDLLSPGAASFAKNDFGDWEEEIADIADRIEDLAITIEELYEEDNYRNVR